MAGGRGPLAGGRGVLVDRVLHDLLRNDPRVSKDAWRRNEEDEFERLRSCSSGERHGEIASFFAQLGALKTGQAPGIHAPEPVPFSEG